MTKQREADRKPTTAESLDATISCMGGNSTWHSTGWALRTALSQLERGDSYSADKVALLRKRLERGGRIVKPSALLDFRGDWVATLQGETKRPGRRAQIALLTVMELPQDTALLVSGLLRWTLTTAGWIPSDNMRVA